MTVRNIFKKPGSRRISVCMGVATLGAVLISIHTLIQPDKRSENIGVSTARPHQLRVPELSITKIVQHGHIVEIQATVEPGATVMVNGEKAAVIWGDGEIKHFVGPLPDGVNDIAITVQTDEGGLNSKQLSVVLP